MVAIAKCILPDVQGWTAPAGPALLTSMTVLRAAAEHVAAAEVPDGIGGIIVSAFGDPGRAALAARLDIPVIGIGESAALAAASGGRRFAVVTHTPELVVGIDMLMRATTPSGAYLGTFLTDGDPLTLSADEKALDAALLAATYQAWSAGAEAVIVGGGPLGQSAERLCNLAPCDLVAPIPEAARRMLFLMKDRQ